MASNYPPSPPTPGITRIASSQPVTQVTVSRPRRTIHVAFKYNEKILTRIKALPRRKYDPDTKSWNVPADS